MVTNYAVRQIIGELKGFPDVPLIIAQWQRTRNLTAAQHREMQNSRLHAIIRHSYNHVPYYHRLFKKANLHPDNIKTIGDLHKIPITQKADIRNLPIQDITANDFSLRRCELRKTSGSSGIPLTCYRDGRYFFKRCFDEYLFHLSHGGSVSDRRVLMGGIVPLPPIVIQRLGFLRTKEVSPLKHPFEQLREITGYRAKTLLTNPSSALAVSKEAIEADQKGFALSLVFTVGEFLLPSTRRLIEDTFGAKVVDQYGATEVGKISRQCHDGSYHIHHNVIVEVTKNGETLSQGEEGEIAVTNIDNYCQPFIRYNLQDSGLVLQDKCSCGLSHPLMKLTSGRVSDFIKLPSGRLISALEANDFLSFMQTELKQYQVTQKAPDQLTVKIVKGKSFNEKTATTIKQSYRQILGSEVEVDCLLVDEISREKSGKFKLFKTEIA